MRRALAGIVVLPLAAFAIFVSAPTSTLSLFHRPIVVVGANQSNNWSGYNQGAAEQGGKLFSQVAGNWVVPTASTHRAGEDEYSSSWVGIGGGCVTADCLVTDGTLIQAGTEQDVDSSGRASYSAWWELIPAPSVPIDNFTVGAGDRIHVNIAEAAPGSNVWTVTVQDLSRGESFSLTVPYSSTHATAEWIEETPVVVDSNGNVSVGPLPKLSTVTFDLGQTNGANAGLKASEEIQLVDFDGNVLATPSAPDKDTDGFNDCTYAGSCRAPRRS